jgi:hypothetical protein
MATASPVTVKRLQDGLLFVPTDYVSGNIGLDWNQVKSVQSTAIYRIVLTNGKRLEGKIEKYSIDSPTTQDFSIREATEETQVPSLQIVSIDSRSPTFWRQLQGDIDFGYSFTGGNSQSTLNSDTSGRTRPPDGKSQRLLTQRSAVSPVLPKQIAKTFRERSRNI